MELIVKLTRACNLACAYCSEGESGKEILSKDVLFKAIDEVPAILDKYNDKRIDLLWHGGEPMLVGKEYLSSVMEYARKKLSAYELSFSMQTNSTLMDDEWLGIIKKYDVGIGISLDGYEELHDSNRRTIDGKPTFAKVIANIDKLRNMGMSAGTLMVYSNAQNIDLLKLQSLIEEHELNIKIHPVVPVGKASQRKDIGEVNNDYLELIKNLYRWAVNVDADIEIEPIGGILRAVLGNQRVTECSYAGSCGISFLTIYTDGTVGFCGRCKEEKYKYGDLHTSNLLKLYESEMAKRVRNRVNYLKKHDCRECNIWQYCHGGCTEEAVNSFGTLEVKYPNCAFRKEIIKFIMDEGLELLKGRLVREKRGYRALISEREKLIKAVRNDEPIQ